MRRMSLALALTLVGAACTPADPIDAFGTPVAWVDGEPILLETVAGRADAATPEARRARVEEAVAEHLAAREARRRGLVYAEQVVGRLASIRLDAAARERRLLGQALRDVETGDTQVSEAEARAYFDARRDVYTPRLVTLRVGGFATEAAAREAVVAWREGREAGLREVGPHATRTLPPELRRVAARLEAPGTHAIEPSGAGWRVVVLVDASPGEPVAFERVREAVEERVRRKLEQERFDAQVDRLRAEAEITIAEPLLRNDAAWAPHRR